MKPLRFIALAGLTSCAALSPAAQEIKMASKAEVAGCKFLSVVYGGKQAGDLRPKHTALENAASLRATHLVTLFEQGGKYTGDAYDCRETAIAAAPVVASDDVVPDPAPVEPNVEPVALSSPPVKKTWVVAVMGVESKAGKDLDAQLMHNVGSQLRIAIATFGVRTVDPSTQESAVKEHIQRMKSESYQECYDDQCQVELGKALAASHILRSQVTRFGRVCVLNGELIDLRSEVAIGAASSRGDCTDEGFLGMIDEVARELVGS